MNLTLTILHITAVWINGNLEKSFLSIFLIIIITVFFYEKRKIIVNNVADEEEKPEKR